MIVQGSPDRRAVLQAALVLPALGWAGAGIADAAGNRVTSPGIALVLAQRRATQISDIRYDIALDLTATDRATGTVTTTFTRRDGTGDLVLDFRGPMLADLTVNGQSLSSGDSRDGHIVLPERLLRPGANTLSARFATPIAAAGAPMDSRRKVLLARDELERTVKIRGHV